jgi:hypothetical protein
MTTRNVPARAETQWRKSSYSTAGNNCVEVATPDGPADIAVRDSKNPDGGHLTFGAEAWRAFISDIQHGRYDSL